VCKEARYIGVLNIVSCCKMRDQMLVGEVCSLGKTIHALINTKEDSVVTKKLVEIIFVDDVGGNELRGDGDEFRTIERCAEKEIDNVERGESGIVVEIVSIRYHRVEKSTNREEVSSSGRDFARIIYSITTNGTADTSNDLVLGRIVLLFGFRVVIGDVRKSIWGTVGASNGRHCARINKSGNLVPVHSAPLRRIGPLRVL